MKVTKGKATTLVKRIAKHKKDIIRFASNPNVEYHINAAERKFKNLIQARKNSFSSDNPKGAMKTCVTHSVIETLKQLKIKAVDFIKKSLEEPDFRIFSIEELKKLVF